MSRIHDHPRVASFLIVAVLMTLKILVLLVLRVDTDSPFTLGASIGPATGSVWVMLLTGALLLVLFRYASHFAGAR